MWECLPACVCPKRRKHREKKEGKERTILTGNVRRKSIDRKAGGAFVINQLSSGSGQVSASSLALFTHRLGEALKPAGSRR